MTTATLTLTDFILARIAEDEAAARAAIGATVEPDWCAKSYRVVTAAQFEVAEASVPSAAHIARHDPARVLAECEAHRRIVESAEFAEQTPSIHDDARTYMRAVLRRLAAIYADHPDYREEWRS